MRFIKQTNHQHLCLLKSYFSKHSFIISKMKFYTYVQNLSVRIVNHDRYFYFIFCKNSNCENIYLLYTLYTFIFTDIFNENSQYHIFNLYCRRKSNNMIKLTKNYIF